MSQLKRLIIMFIIWITFVVSLNFFFIDFLDPMGLIATALVGVLLLAVNRINQQNPFIVVTISTLSYLLISVLTNYNSALQLNSLLINALILVANVSILHLISNSIKELTNLDNLLGENKAYSNWVLPYNSGAQKATQEFYRARRFNRSVSVVYCQLVENTKDKMILVGAGVDIELRKNIYNHILQNGLIKSIAALTYKHDILMEYEKGYLVCLAEADEANTQIFLDNLCKLVNEQFNMNLTAGVAMFPRDGFVFEELAKIAFEKAHNWPKKLAVPEEEATMFRQGDFAIDPARRFEIERRAEWVNKMNNVDLLTRHRYEQIKRMIDIVIIMIILPIILPTLLLTALAIKLDDGGSIIYRQKRTGYNGNRFTIYKFRTMVENAPATKLNNPEKIYIDNVAHYIFPDKVESDGRITRLGRILRKTSIDELPQLLNILKGDMSIVGPRPFSWDLSRYTLHQTERLTVRPGITGLWQVCGRDGYTFDERALWDIKYIDRMSFLLDLQILFLTFTQILKRGNA